jgi:hypothetical protein
MTRLREAFDVLVDRGEPIGADELFARAREAAAAGGLAELQPAPMRRRPSLWIAAAVVASVAIIAAVVALTGGHSNEPVAVRVPTHLECRASLGSKTTIGDIRVADGAVASLGIGSYTAKFVIVLSENGSGTIRVDLSGPTLSNNHASAPVRLPRVPGLGGKAITPDGYLRYGCGTSTFLASLD